MHLGGHKLTQAEAGLGAPLSKNTSGRMEFWIGLFITWQAKRNVITLSGLRGMDRESLAQGSSQTATDFTQGDVGKHPGEVIALACIMIQTFEQNEKNA